MKEYITPIVRMNDTIEEKKEEVTVRRKLDVSADDYEIVREEPVKPKRKRKMVPSKRKMKPDSSIKGDDEDKPKSNPRDAEDFYERRFNPIIENFKSNSEKFKDIRESLEAEVDELKVMAKKSRSGAVLDYLAKQTTNVINLCKNEVDVTKEIGNIYNKISDLELKKSRAVKDTNAGNNNSLVVSKLYEKLMTGPSSTSMNDVYDSGVLKEPMTMENTMPYDSYIDQYLDSRYNDEVKSGKIQETSADTNLIYADKRVEIRVIRSESADNWRFAAIDIDNEQEIEDYLKPAVVGTMKFDFDNYIAYDNVRKYPLILVPDSVDYVDTEYISSMNDNVEEDPYYNY